jgi:5,10-methylenetetrahydromethanopterin reductase
MTMLHEGESSARVAELAAFAESRRFDFVGIADSQSIFRELYSTLALCAARTSTIMLGPTTTNPVSRHPVVTASAVATIDEISGGRAFLCIGTGNSALYNLSLKPSKLADFHAAVDRINNALNGAIPADGRAVDLKWAKRRYPVLVAAAGPKAMTVAAHAADGVVLDVGADPKIVAGWVRHLTEQRKAGPRAADPFSVWVYTKGYVASTTAEAREPIAQIVAAAGNDAFRYALESKGVPPELVEPLQEFHRRYSFASHASVSSRTNVNLMEELGLADFLYRRFSIAGTSNDVVVRLKELEAVGVDGVLFSGVVPNKELLIEKLSGVFDSVRLEQRPDRK